MLEKGYDVIYVSSPDFFSKLEGLHFGSDPADEEETLLQTAANADLLILDDLGSEFMIQPHLRRKKANSSVSTAGRTKQIRISPTQSIGTIAAFVISMFR